MVHADEKPSTPPAELDAEETQSSDQSFRGQLYWILPIVIATLAVTLWLLLNPRWGGEVAAIVVIPINVAAVLVPLLLSFSAKGESARRTRRAKKLKVATAFTMAALLLSGGIYWATGEPAPKNYLSGAAERGGQNANLDAEARSASEKAGQNTAGFQAQLMQQELSSRRAEIQQALQGAQGLLTAEQAMKLQDELAHLNTALSAWGTTQSLGANESQFARQLAERGYEYDSDNQFRNSPLYGG